MQPSRRLQATVLLVGTLLVFGVHFRPWEVGYLEEWPLAADWNGYGGGAFTASYLEWTMSRPLHLFPSMLGLVLGGGSPSGIFAVLGLVAAMQLPAVVWALRPVARSYWTSVTVGAAFALHPLWAGGYLQRFLPAQTAALALVIMTGLLTRWLMTGRVGWLISAGITIFVGYLVYPGPTGAAPLVALALALTVRTSRTRKIWAVATITSSSVLMTLYSLVLSRFILPGGTSYEIGNIEVAGVRSVRDLVTYVGTTLFAQGEAVVAAIVGVGILGALLTLTGSVPYRAGWLIAAFAAVSPLVTVVYFGHVGWLSDIERLSYVMSLALFAGLVTWTTTATHHRTRLQRSIAILLLLIAVVGAWNGIARWQPYIQIQHRLLDALGPAVREAGDGDIVVVVDRSATLGLEPTFPLQYLASASRVWNQDSTPVWLCFPEHVAVPSGAVVCDPKDTGHDMRLITSLPQGTGKIDIYIGRQDLHD